MFFLFFFSFLLLFEKQRSITRNAFFITTVFTVYTSLWKPWIAFDALVSFWDWIDVNDKRERMENGSTGDKEKDGCKDVILWKYFQREKNFIGGRGLRVKMKFLIQDIILYILSFSSSVYNNQHLNSFTLSNYH